MRSRKYLMNYNQSIPNSTRFSDINGWLANLSGVWKVTDLLSAIRQISNSPDIDDIKQIGKIHVYADQSNLIDIDCLYIDFDCQRIFHLRKAVKKISSSHGGEYKPEACGAIDVAIRPDGTHFVWDGLHRTILAGLAGFTQIPISEYRHPSRASNLECQQAEARFFKMRNADSEPMKPEEIWKAKVVYGDDKALRLKALLALCSLDVLGVVDRSLTTKLGGFKEIENQYLKGHDLSDESLKESSRILRSVFSNPNSLSVFLWCGLAYFLQVNDESAEEISYSEGEVEDAIRKCVDEYEWTQTSFIKPRLAGKTCESVAYRIAKDVLKDTNGLRDKFANKLSKEDLEIFENQTNAKLNTEAIDIDESDQTFLV